jgi:cytoskeleton protein RodZ
MSDSSFRDDAADGKPLVDGETRDPAAGALQETAGALLRQAREAAGLHIAALALELKVPVKKLEALEQDRLDVFSGAVFARALAGSVCRSLKVDAVPVLARLPQSRVPELGALHHAQRRQFHGAGARLAQPVFPAVSRTVWIAGGVLVAGALGLFVWSFIRKPADAVDIENKAAVKYFPSNAESGALGFSRDAVSGPVNEAVATSFPTDQSDRQAELANALSLTGSLVPDDPVDRLSQPIASMNIFPPSLDSVSLAPPRDISARSGSTAAPVSGILALMADGESWVQVTDAHGVVLLSRTLEAGEAVATSGALPMEAVLGRADVIRVQVRGKQFDVASMTRDNVARFKVR